MRRPTLGLLGTAGYVAAVMLLVLMAVLVRSYRRHLETVANAVRHTNDVIETLNEATASLLDLRTAERALVVTGNPAYRGQFEKDVEAISDGYREAESLTRDNPRQRARAARIITLADRSVENARAALAADEARRRKFSAGPPQPIGDERWRRVRDEDRETVRELFGLARNMTSEENRLLTIRRAQARTALDDSSKVVLLALALALILVVISTWASATNIGRRKDAQQEQERLQQIVELQAAREANARFQERFIGILGHDLRNPLTAILMGASALQRYASPATELKVVGRIQSSAERMRRMIEQLLDLTRARHGGGIPVELKSCDVAGVVRRVLDELEMAHPERTLTLDVRGDATGECDGDRLGQVVSNLVGNAIRHGERDGRVDVILEGDGDAVTLTVRNSGAPIAPELLPVMFDPFRRGNASSSGGLGLGLFITQQIVHAHGGTIDVMSSAESGTTFAVRLPRRKPAGDGEMTNGIGAAQPQTPVL